ncbi:MAG: D-alanyl-D-alanine dipeptidase [Flavobacteriales bacterium]|jgi:D-alanyl-D-alanine dipeptidase|tara:strand:- start:1252 stop:1917 length:666 start_codon:yes stop_codon:yes gene_type:complete
MKSAIKIIFFFVYFQSFGQLPNDFAYVQEEIPTIKIELRYFSDNNFVGTKVDGYEANVVILSSQATKALKRVQYELLKDSLSLKIYDAYRPQRAVSHFWRWAKDVNDTLTKQQFYPNVKKKNLFKEGYIATRSGHSSGSTIDITLVDLKTNKELDMGTPYDFFGPESWVAYNSITVLQKANRDLLQNVMKKQGFRNYPQEWWHFTLRDEPFLNQYFDFVIE